MFEASSLSGRLARSPDGNWRGGVRWCCRDASRPAAQLAAGHALPRLATEKLSAYCFTRPHFPAPRVQVLPRLCSCGCTTSKLHPCRLANSFAAASDANSSAERPTWASGSAVEVHPISGFSHLRDTGERGRRGGHGGARTQRAARCASRHTQSERSAQRRGVAQREQNNPSGVGTAARRSGARCSPAVQPGTGAHGAHGREPAVALAGWWALTAALRRRTKSSTCRSAPSRAATGSVRASR